MMLQQGGPGLIGNSGEGDAAAAGAGEHVGGSGSGGSYGGGLFIEEEKGRSEESERFSGGNRWPRQETIALLKIRSDMDVAFRDSSLKGPLWEEVSRKLSELGYHRSAKKCKEKFENVYKYHKRTKDGRTTKPDGKTYRFFEQLEALDTHPPTLPLSSPMRSQAPIAVTTMPTSMADTTHITPPIIAQVTVSSTPISPITRTTTPHVVFQNNASTPLITKFSSHQSSQPANAPSYNPNTSFLTNSSSSSTSSDERPERRRKRKRKWKEFFGRLMSEVIQKQDELQKKFLDTLEKRERDRMIREEAGRVQEMAKMNREHDLLVQERSMAAAKDAALIAFLQKITEQKNPISAPQLQQIQVQVQQNNNPLPTPTPPPVTSAPGPATTSVSTPASVSTPVPVAVSSAAAPTPRMDITPSNNAGGDINFVSPSPSRWPKAEVQALIDLRTTLDTKYHESGPKGPLWEEISAGMRKMGYNRNAKRCKEKWENINKYYKKVKESNKKRPEDAKTCPYFHQLEALYKDKAKTYVVSGSFNPGLGIKPDQNPMVLPIMVQPEQQWPLPHQNQLQQQQDSAMEDHESDNVDDQNNDDYEDEDEDEDDDDDGVGQYEIVTNKQQPSSAATVG